MRLRTIGLAAGFTTLLLVTGANAQEFPPALELSTIQKATTPKAAELQVGGTAQNFGGSEEHQKGVGAVLGGYNLAIGGSGRVFFGGPLGIQFSAAHIASGLNEIQAAVLFRLSDIQVNENFILTPYLGGGLSYLDTPFNGACDDVDDLEDDLEDIFDEDFDFDCDDGGGAGAVIIGGVEAFFRQIPPLGVSGEININTNNFGGFGGPAFVVRAHWYFD